MGSIDSMGATTYNLTYLNPLHSSASHLDDRNFRTS